MTKPNYWWTVPRTLGTIAAGFTLGAFTVLAVQHRRRPRRWPR